MKITKHLTIDMVSSGVSAVVDVMQGDEMTRQVSVSLYDAGRPWEPPEGVEASVSFRKPDSVAGWYDTMPDGSAACTIAGNLVTAQLVPEITQISGLVSANLIFRNAVLQQVGSFPFVIRVIPSPAAGKQISNPYYNVSSLKQLNEELNKKANKEQTVPLIVTLDAESGFASHAPFQMKLHAEAGGSVYLDTGEILISMSATNDDDIAVFTWIDDEKSVIHKWEIADDNGYWYSELPIGGGNSDCTNCVKTVNDNKPNEDGNVTIQTYKGKVITAIGNKASYNGSQIRTFVNNGYAVVLNISGITASFSYGTGTTAIFSYVSPGGNLSQWAVGEAGNISQVNSNFVLKGTFESAIGDISTALDHIIELQEELIGV